MADGVEGYFRNDASKEDSRLPEDLKKYVQQLFTRNEILSFMRRDFPSKMSAVVYDVGYDTRMIKTRKNMVIVPTASVLRKILCF